MDARLQKYYDLLEIDRKILLQQLSLLTEAQRNTTYHGKWSINQILAHLLTAERLSLVYMKKKSQGIEELDDSGILESLKMLVLIFSQRVPLFKFKAPKAVVNSTPIGHQFEDIQKKWDDFRMELKSFLENIPPQHVRRKIYKHTIAGRLDAAQAILFLREHFHHHMPQIRRLMASFHLSAKHRRS